MNYLLIHLIMKTQSEQNYELALEIYKFHTHFPKYKIHYY